MGSRSYASRALTAVVLAVALAAVALPGVALAKTTFTYKVPSSGSSTTATKPKISVYIYDSYGIKGTTSYLMKIDGKTVKPRISYKKRGDYKRVTVSFQITSVMKLGSHTVYVRIKNTRRKYVSLTWKFTVKATTPPIPPDPPAPSPMPVTIAPTDCNACHVGYPVTHPMTQCGLCHGDGRPQGDPSYSPGDESAHTLACSLESPCHGGTGGFPHVLESDCARCHSGGYSGIGAQHSIDAEPAHASSSTACTVTGCHLKSLTLEHYRRSIGGVALSCATCHSSTSARVTAAIKAGSTACGSCHSLTATHSFNAAGHAISGSCIATGCHAASAVGVHSAAGGPGCDACHGVGRTPSLVCASCHPGTVGQVHAIAQVAHTASAGTCVTSLCHLADVTAVHGAPGGPGCVACHATGKTPSVNCVTCHPGALEVIHPLIGTAHTAPVDGCVSSVCHKRDVTAVHGAPGGPGCAACHEAGVTPTISCAGCHPGDLTPRHAAANMMHTTVSPNGCMGGGCHLGDVARLHGATGGPGCTACHGPGRTASTTCSPCHSANPAAVHPLAVFKHAAPAGTCVSSSCHASSVTITHGVVGCAVCHATGKTLTLVCGSCHAGDLVALHPVAAHSAPTSTCVQSGCHSAGVAVLHKALSGSGCSTCHGPGKTPSLTCGNCHSSDLTPRHPSANGAHTAPASSCVTAGCHAPNVASMHGVVGGPGCAACHAPGKTPSLACAACHVGDIPALHANATKAHTPPRSTCVQLGCHYTDAATLHTKTGGPGCAACHAVGVVASITCADCHRGDLTSRHPSATADHAAPASLCVTAGCHAVSVASVHGVTGGPGCAACHAPGKTPTLVCAMCHVGNVTTLHPNAPAKHTSLATGCSKAGCHSTDATAVHGAPGGPGCSACHAAGKTASLTCASCHPGHGLTLHPQATVMHVSPAGSCISSRCHATNVMTIHGAGGGTGCAQCHTPHGKAGVPGCAACHAAGKTLSVKCADCHAGVYATIHATGNVPHTLPTGSCVLVGCHVTDALALHKDDCSSCHAANRVPSAVCSTCHTGDSTTVHLTVIGTRHTAPTGTCVTSSCHVADVAAVHGVAGGPGCAACHAAGKTPVLTCATCHPAGFTAAHPAPVAAHTAPSSGCVGVGCHAANAATVHGAPGGPGCTACHASGKTPSLVCSNCHLTDLLPLHPGAAAKHAAPASSCVTAGCHVSDVAAVHGATGGPGCGACHGLGKTPSLVCGSCHVSDIALLHPNVAVKHVSPASSCVTAGGCHISNAIAVHGAPGGPGCAACHSAGKTLSLVCDSCHPGHGFALHPGFTSAHIAPAGSCVLAGCHIADAVSVHSGSKMSGTGCTACHTTHGAGAPGCAACHAAGRTPSMVCSDCHATNLVTVHPAAAAKHAAPTGSCVTAGCHTPDVAALHAVTGGPGCAACHKSGVTPSLVCESCHSSFTASHPVPAAAHTAPADGPCSVCHVTNVATLHGATGGPSCAACHAANVTPSLECGACHASSQLSSKHPSGLAAHTSPVEHACQSAQCHGPDRATAHAGSLKSCTACHSSAGATPRGCYKTGTYGTGCHDLGWASFHAGYATYGDYHGSKNGDGRADIDGYYSTGGLLAPYTYNVNMPCSTCHVQSGTSNKYNFPTVINGKTVTVPKTATGYGSSYPSLCSACHGGGVKEWHTGCSANALLPQGSYCHDNGDGTYGPDLIGSDCSNCHQHDTTYWPHGPGWGGMGIGRTL